MKFFLRKVIKYLLVFLEIPFNIFKINKNQINILMYHRVKNSVKKELSVKLNNFKWHMDYLSKSNHKVISMDDAYKRIITNNIDDSYVVLTFDDGYEDFYYNVYPILEKYKFPSILYIVPDYIETNKVFWWDRDLNKSELLNWIQIKKLLDNGMVDIGSHTCNHLDLNNLDKEQLLYEIRFSKYIIEEKLDIKVKHFSYPRGIYDKTAEKIIKKYYDTGVLIFNGEDISHKTNKCNLLKLKRIPIQRSDGKYLFVARLNGLLNLEEIIRKILKLLNIGV